MPVGLADTQRRDVTFTLAATTSSQGMSLIAAATIPGADFWDKPADDRTPYEREKAAFRRKEPFLRQHAGEFVAIHGGEIAVTENSRNAVVRKFFARHPAGASVYIGFVGRKPAVRVTSQFFVRRPS